MTVFIRHVVTQEPKRKRIFVDIPRVGKQGVYKISAPDVVDQVGKKWTSERKIADVRRYGPAVCIRVRLFQVRRSRPRKFGQKKRPDGACPAGIDQGLMGEYRIPVRGLREKKDHHEDERPATHFGDSHT